MRSRFTVMSQLGRIEGMLGRGTRPGRILTALHLNAATVTRTAYKAGRPDLARQFEPIVYAKRRERERAPLPPAVQQRIPEDTTP